MQQLLLRIINTTIAQTGVSVMKAGVPAFQVKVLIRSPGKNLGFCFNNHSHADMF